MYHPTISHPHSCNLLDTVIAIYIYGIILLYAFEHCYIMKIMQYQQFLSYPIRLTLFHY